MERHGGCWLLDRENRAATAHHARVMRRRNAPSDIAFYHWRKKDESQGQRTRAMLPQRANLLRRQRAGKAIIARSLHVVLGSRR